MSITLGCNLSVNDGVGGIVLWCIAINNLPSPANPAATNVCPKLPLDDPNDGNESFPNTASIVDNSALSPNGVPVAWHSTY